ncbi:myb-related transcription factor, partner of profilin-like isoform X1 [Haliotis rubra]|uniref:myb-related transcription factor, partner of profilin-like isoform X1 n=1 Tax=Haliotis rubra TaxID=36100 RepID=UPI001EE5A89E|nr:myb-related transcription factor, partner of profilin-like isoform X1 [Haliotis rubra]
MNPSAPVSVIRLPPELPTVVMGDGTRCLIDNNTIWMPAGNPVGLSLGAGYQQPGLVPSRLQPPTVQPPPCSRHKETMPVCQPSSAQDLQLMRPEAFSCVLPQLDLPSPVPPPQSLAHVDKPAMPTTNNPKPKVQPKQNLSSNPANASPKRSGQNLNQSLAFLKRK